MVSTVVPRMTNSPRGGSGVGGAAADREAGCWPKSSPDAATRPPNVAACLSIVRRLIRMRVMSDLPVSHRVEARQRHSTSARYRRLSIVPQKH